MLLTCKSLPVLKLYQKPAVFFLPVICQALLSNFGKWFLLGPRSVRHCLPRYYIIRPWYGELYFFSSGRLTSSFRDVNKWKDAEAEGGRISVWLTSPKQPCVFANLFAVRIYRLVQVKLYFSQKLQDTEKKSNTRVLRILSGFYSIAFSYIQGV